MERMKEKKIACITYHKHPKDDWQIDEFRPQILQTVAGNQIEVYLAERGTRLTKTLWVREIRRLRKNGHQTSILSTDYRSDSVIFSTSLRLRRTYEIFLQFAPKTLYLQGFFI
jgi:hypothetical protein